ncbi:family 10 glycosylhydrolase [Phormidium pseudopriestleyi FRX01]|uniref:Family 10 glycosylhydrolase n=1 Tax=Phormidium pseudopriestleyi FRX01 TaxID=1759528 RepID=A0ABS3FQW9_9CYAN|nr:family 10 glycosylhydrolase [Phormidium pseudopriestleyi]MBO0349522.1 family 10 glycosylhydrolase [Phormidium pseudopriestleyi FRX01]
MPRQKKEPGGCGCASIPFSVILLILGGGYLLFTQREHLNISRFIPEDLRKNIPLEISRFIPEDLQQKIPFLNASNPADEVHQNLPEATPTPEAPPQQPRLPAAPISNPSPPTPTAEIKPPANLPENPLTPSTPQSLWEQKAIRGIYFSRYQITNNATEETIRARVRYYRDRGINTLIHGVWGNACTMYKSAVMQAKFGYESCPNEFEDKWLDWLIDEAQKHDMEVHAYFEKGIKIDENSPAFDLAVQRGWIVPGVDRTHPGVDHYVLNVGVPEVGEFFTNILVEFVTKYPTIDAVQWDDYLGYHAELPGQVDRTLELTNFVKKAISATKAANPSVSFDICHHNPYWAKRYFAADWENWGVDRVFIQVYADENFAEELPYVEAYDGISITERQFNRLEELVRNPKVDNILLFPLSGEPEKMADEVNRLTSKIK